jgi:acetylornithine deacetylase/succinyl-diaminopimelate desuccinylase-like protein
MESDEESGNDHIDHYMDALKDRIGKNVKIVWILDAGAGNYKTFWLNTSLRGNLKFEMNIEVAKESVHSGKCSGVIPECMRISRILMNRIEDSKTGRMHD